MWAIEAHEASENESYSFNSSKKETTYSVYKRLLDVSML